MPGDGLAYGKCLTARRCRAVLLWVSVGLTACPGEEEPPPPPDPIPGFVLTLQPRVADGTDPFAGDPEISLVVRRGDDVDVTLLGTASDPLALPELDPLEAGDVLGLLAERPGGDPDAWDPELAVAYGQVVLTEDVPDDGGTVDVDVLVTPIGELAPLGIQSPARIGAGVAMVEGGDVYVFAGADPARAFDNNGATRTVFVLEDTDEGDTDTRRLDVQTPTFSFLDGSSGSTVYGSTAVRIDDRDGERILLVGGRPGFLDIDANSSDAFLFDPAERDWVMDGEAPLRIDAESPVSGLHPLLLDNGDVLFYGGVVNASQLPADVVLYETARRRFQRINTSSLSNSTYEPSAASLGPQGAIVCGGTDLPPGDDSFAGAWPAQSSCLRVGLAGAIQGLAPLPVPLAHHAMVRLADGRVLVTGGMEGELAPPIDATPTNATARAFLYDPTTDTWSEVGQMNKLRAGHRMVALPDGGALVVGGVRGMGVIFGKTRPSETCWERFDVESETFALGACDSTGDGANPMVTHHPGDGAFVLAGYQDDYSDLIATGTYGLIATGPE